jgi:hypothetical protein
MAKYIEWIVYKGQRILLAKFLGIHNEKEYLDGFDELEQEILRQPKGSKLLMLIDVTDSVLSQVITDRGKRLIAAAQEAGIPASPTVMVGVKGFQKAVVQAMQFFRKELHTEDTLEQAKEWLIKQ